METKQCKSLNLGIRFSPPFLLPKTTFSTNHLQTSSLKFFIFMACYTILQTILDFVVPYKLWKMRNFVSYIALFFLFSFTLLPRIHCAEGAFAPSFYTDEIYKELQNIAILLNKDIKSSLGFCIKDPWVLFHHSVLFFYFNYVSIKAFIDTFWSSMYLFLLIIILFTFFSGKKIGKKLLILRESWILLNLVLRKKVQAFISYWDFSIWQSSNQIHPKF